MCWRGDECELANGLKQGIETVARHLQTQADLVDQRVSPFRFHFVKLRLTGLFQTQGLQHETLEALKVSRAFEPMCFTLIPSPVSTGSIYRHARSVLPANAIVY